MDIACIILAGGKGLRLGRDKVREVVGNSNLLQRVLSQLAPFSRDLIIVTAGEKSLPKFTSCQRFRIVIDAYPGKGVLGGIYTGLAESNSEYNLAVACDMPFLNQALLRYMIELTAGFDLVVPHRGEFVEPLHAVYARSCLAPIGKLLSRGNLEVRALFELVNVRHVEAEEIDKFDPKHLSFFNINIEADLNKASQMVMGDVKL